MLNMKQNHDSYKAINDELQFENDSHIAKQVEPNQESAPQVVTQATPHCTNCFASTSSSNVIVPIALSSHIISLNVHVFMVPTDSPPRQVVLQQENARLKEILVNGIFKCHKGSEKFNELLSKQTHRRYNDGVGFMHQYKSSVEPWDLEQYPKTQYPETQFVAQKNTMLLVTTILYML